jgi:hypothetical protein
MTSQEPKVSRYRDCDQKSIKQLLSRYELKLEHTAPGSAIRGSFWGDEEAGLIGNLLVVRDDTPLHSILHEACHYVCMDNSRRDGLNTNAGGDYDEENAVCYLQLLLAEEITGFTQTNMFQDMDAWGYSFRLGSARAWFEQDAEDAQQWLVSNDLITTQDRPTFALRS